METHLHTGRCESLVARQRETGTNWQRGSPDRGATMTRWLMGLAVLALSLVAGPAMAEVVDIELVLAVDVSGSIDAYEFELQRKGYAEAFRDPRVLDAIRANKVQRIAVTMVEWSGAEFQTQIVPWMVVRDKPSAEALAAAILAPPRGPGRWTSISGGIDYSMKLFRESPHKSERRVIDVSGDGVNNSGRPAEVARDEALKAGVVINGLAIMNDRPNPYGGFYRQPEPPLDEYYTDKVIGGPGSFLIVTNDFEGFERAVVTKLVREIAGIEIKPATGLAAR